MSDTHTRDLTTGPPLKLMFSFMIPMVLGMLFQQFYSMVDTIVVGNFLGVDALAGVGSTGSITFLVLGLCNGICSGFAIPVAQKFGEKDYDGLSRFVGNMTWLTALIAAIITLVTAALCGTILTLMDTPDEVFHYAYDYLIIIFIGIPATMLYNLLSGIMRSLGDSKTPLYFLILSSFLNIGLDVLFIVTFGMGVAGAGWATLLSQLVSGLLCLVFMAKKFPVIRINRESLTPDSRFVRRLLTMGLPMGIQYSITAIGSILIQTSINGLGPAAMAATTAGSKVTMFCICPFDAVGSSSATFAGQNIGAGKPERVHQGVKALAALGSIYSAIIFVILYFFGSNLTMLFLDPTEGAAVTDIIAMSKQFLTINSAFYIPLMLLILVRFTIQGLGYSNLAVFAGVVEMVARGVVALCLVPVFGFAAVCFANPVAWFLPNLFLIPTYLYCLKKRGYTPWRRQKSLADAE